MFKRVVSLWLSFLMLFEFGTGSAFAKGDGDFNTAKDKDTEEPKYVDYCRDYPKNKFGQPIKVSCAIKENLPDFKLNDNHSLTLENLGDKGELEVHLWKYIGINGLINSFNQWIKRDNSFRYKNEFLADFIEKSKDTFDLDSNAEAADVINQWIKKSSVPTVLEITKEDIAEWKKNNNSEDERLGSEKWWSTLGGGAAGLVGGTAIMKLVGAAALASGGVGLVAGGLLAVGGYFKGKAQISKEKLRLLKEAEKYKIKTKVYATALDSIFQSVKSNEWKGNDLLVANLNFDEKKYEARTEFRNVGVKLKCGNITEIFADFSKRLSNLMKKYNISKEEL